MMELNNRRKQTIHSEYKDNTTIDAIVSSINMQVLRTDSEISTSLSGTKIV
jgi:hypothetical protein